MFSNVVLWRLFAYGQEYWSVMKKHCSVLWVVHISIKILSNTECFCVT